VRGLLTAAFFAADAYLPLMVVDGRGADTWVAGAALSATALAWAAADVLLRPDVREELRATFREQLGRDPQR
jgi:hypothetical protein